MIGKTDIFEAEHAKTCGAMRKSQGWVDVREPRLRPLRDAKNVVTERCLWKFMWPCVFHSYQFFEFADLGRGKDWTIFVLPFLVQCTTSSQ